MCSHLGTTLLAETRTESGNMKLPSVVVYCVRTLYCDKYDNKRMTHNFLIIVSSSQSVNNQGAARSYLFGDEQ